jgi:hypothetical protein
MQRKRGFDDGRDGIKKKAGIAPAFQYHGSFAAG